MSRHCLIKAQSKSGIVRRTEATSRKQNSNALLENSASILVSSDPQSRVLRSMQASNQTLFEFKSNISSSLHETQNNVKKIKKKKMQNVRTSKTLRHTVSETNVQNVIDKKCKSNSGVSKKVTCEIKESITTERSKKSHYKQRKGQRTEKSTYNFQINKKYVQKKYYTSCRYKGQIKSIRKNSCFGGAQRKQSTNNFSNTTVIQSSMNDTVSYDSCKNNKKLAIALVKVDHLSLSEISKLILDPNYVENVPKKGGTMKTYYQTRNMTKAQISTYKQYSSTELREDEEINVVYHKSVFKTSHTFFQENYIEGIEGNKHKALLGEEVNDMVTSGRNINKLEDTCLLESILEFFLKQKRNIRNKTSILRSKVINSENIYEHEMRKCVAICFKCKEVLNLLQQFSSKSNFMQDENLCIECTLCNLQLNSLSSFQQHVMDIHLQCEGNLETRKKFVVHLVTFKEDLYNDNRTIFECCCCSTVFHSQHEFEKHIKRMHRVSNIMMGAKRCNAEQGVMTSSLYAKYKREQIFNENYILNRNLERDSKLNMQELTKQKMDSNFQSESNSSKYSVNMKQINGMYHNNLHNKNLLLQAQIQKQLIDDIHFSNKKRQKALRIKQNKFNVGYRNTNNNLNSETADESKHLNTFSTTDKRLFDTGFPYICNICSKNFKRKHIFLSHMAKHIPDFNANVHSKHVSQECVRNGEVMEQKNNNHTRTKRDAYTNNSQDFNKNLVDPDTSTSSISFVRSQQNLILSNIVDNEINSTSGRNMMRMVKQDSSAVEPSDDCTYILHVNLIQRAEKGIKRQKSIKVNVNVSKRCKLDTIVSQSIENEGENQFPVNLAKNANLVLDKDQKNVLVRKLKELHCKVCDKKFNSRTILKEHMFFLHDSLLEDLEFSNLPDTQHLTECYGTENSPLENIPIICNKSETSEENIQGYVDKRNERQEKIACHNFSINNTSSRSKKWRCNPCNENFALLRNYLRHRYYCHNDESVVHVCDNCNKVLTSVAMVNIHTCTNVISWHCKRCNLNFHKAIHLTRHNMKCHFETIGPHTCNICKLSFLTTYMLERHKHRHVRNSNFLEPSVPMENCLPYVINNTHDICVSDDEKIGPMHNVPDAFTKENVEDSKKLLKTYGKYFKMYVDLHIVYNNETVFKCKLCDITCRTKFQMKHHLYKSHYIETELCQICNNLYSIDELIKHLINNHIVLDTLYITDNNANVQESHETMHCEYDISHILGLKRLLALYEYQRFNTIQQDKYFSCTTCSEQFSSIECHRMHYLEHHDIVCLLCNIEFNDNVEAFEHKIKIHVSIDSYLWMVQKLIVAVLQSNKYGSTIEEVILKYSEVRIY